MDLVLQVKNLSPYHSLTSEEEESNEFFLACIEAKRFDLAVRCSTKYVTREFMIEYFDEIFATEFPYALRGNTDLRDLLIKKERYDLLIRMKYSILKEIKDEKVINELNRLADIELAGSSIRTDYAKYRAMELKKEVDIEDINNRQVIIRLQSAVDYRDKKISCEEYCDKLLEAISLTIGDNIERITDKTYLTVSELKTLYNYAMQTKNMQLGKILLENCKNKITEYYMSCLIGKWYASELGNRHEFQESDQCFKKIIYDSLRMYNSWPLPECMYNLMWNEEEKKGTQGIRKYDQDKLQECIDLAVLSSNEFAKEFYLKKR